MHPSGEIVWNILAFNNAGNTDGIVGTGSEAATF